MSKSNKPHAFDPVRQRLETELGVMRAESKRLEAIATAWHRAYDTLANRCAAIAQAISNQEKAIAYLETFMDQEASEEPPPATGPN